MTTSAETNPEEFAERRTWRDALDSLMGRISKGDDVDPADLADTRAKAEAEVEVETGRRTRHQRQQSERDRAAAESEADRIAATIDPDIRATVEAEIAAAHADYLDTIDAAVEKYRTNSEKVAALAAVVARAGVPVVDGLQQSNRTTRVDGDRVVTSPGGRSTPTWRGITFTRPAVEGDRLPHRQDSPRLKAINALRGRMT